MGLKEAEEGVVVKAEVPEKEVDVVAVFGMRSPGWEFGGTVWVVRGGDQVWMINYG